MGNANARADAEYREGVRARVQLAEAIAREEGRESGAQQDLEELAEVEAREAKRRRVGGAAASVPASGEGATPRLLGKGSFGCVLSPPMVCPDGSLAEFAGDETKVSKYATTEELSREFAMYRSLDRMDPEFRFHLRVYGICRASGPDPPGCVTDHLILDWDKPRSIMVMDRSGPSLAALRAGEAEMPANLDLARGYENLVRALGTMAARGLVYGDVTDDNIVVGADGLLRFIDFNRAEFTTPEQARALVLVDLDNLRDLARADVEHYFPGRELTHAAEFAALRRFVSAPLTAADVTPWFSMATS